MDGEDHLISAPPGAGEATHIPGLKDLRIAEPKSGVVEDGLPTHLNEFASGLCCYVWDDKMTVEYHGFGRDHNDAASVQANRPVPKQRLLYYFEMTVKNRGLRGAIAIGFSTENFNTHMQPGLEPNSYGYHGDDGKLFTGYGMGTPFGPQFSTGDTMGAGINYAAQEILFTKNGQLVGRAAFEETEDPLYPTVGLGSLDEKVVVNFGQRPFVFDVAAQEDWERQQRSIESVLLPFLGGYHAGMVFSLTKNLSSSGRSWSHAYYFVVKGNPRVPKIGKYLLYLD